MTCSLTAKQSLLLLPFSLSFPQGICVQAGYTIPDENPIAATMNPLSHPKFSALLLQPDASVFVATVGLCLIFLECNRPGRILPGMAGLLLTLLEAAHLTRLGVRPWASLLLLASAAVPLVNLRHKLPRAALVAATLACIASLRFLMHSGDSAQIHWWLALVCGGSLGWLSATLTSIARRARRAKALD